MPTKEWPLQPPNTCAPQRCAHTGVTDVPGRAGLGKGELGLRDTLSVLAPGLLEGRWQGMVSPADL